MKGVLLAGGVGSRLHPLTLTENKHTLPVGMKRMIQYPIQSLLQAGLDEIVLVTGGINPGRFLDILGNGKQFGIKKLFYTYQDGNGGIADALKLARDFVGDDTMCIILGDNFFGSPLRPFVQNYKGSGARILVKPVPDPERFGVAILEEDGISSQVREIIEKPKRKVGNLAVLGSYIYDHKVWDILETLKPSGRGELEITDVNNAFIKTRDLEAEFYSGFWSDMGTPESLVRTITWLMSDEGKACHHG